MHSRVIHPDIAADDYFNIEVGAREGSVLSPILFLVAIDDMRTLPLDHFSRMRPPPANLPNGSAPKARTRECASARFICPYSNMSTTLFCWRDLRKNYSI